MILKNIFKNKNFQLAILVFLFSFLFWFGIMPGWNSAESDFPNYYAAAQLMKDNNLSPLYDAGQFQTFAKTFNTNAQVSFLMYPPATAWLMIPLTYFDLYTAKQIWILISLLLIFLIAKKVTSLFSIKFFFATLIILCCGFNLVNEIMLGQVYLLMIFIMLLGFEQMMKGDNWLAAVYFALIVSLKYVPLVLFPVLIFAERWRLLLNIIIFTLLIQILTILYTGFDVYKDFFTNGFSNVLTGKVIGEKPMALQYQSFTVLLNNYIDTEKGNASNISLYFLLKSLWTGGLLLLFFRMMSKLRFTKHLLLVGSGGAILTLLLFENGSASYHLLFLMIPFVSLIALNEVKHTYKLLLTIAFIVVGFVPTVISKIILADYNLPLVLYFPRLISLVLFYIVWFITLQKSKLVEVNPQREF